MALVGSFPFNSFLSGVLSCIGTAVLAGKKISCIVIVESMFQQNEVEK